MSLATKRYSRKKFDVDAVQITAENMEQVATWTGGTVIEQGGVKHVKVRVARVLNERQTKGFIGDWVLLQEERGSFKVYTDSAFRTSFDLIELATISSIPGQS